MNHRVNQSLPNAQMENNVLIVVIVIDLTRCIKEKGNKSCEKNTCSVTSCSICNNYLNLKNLTREICFRIKIFNKINPILFFHQRINSFLSQRRRDKNLENRIPKIQNKERRRRRKKEREEYYSSNNRTNSKLVLGVNRCKMIVRADYYKRYYKR